MKRVHGIVAALLLLSSFGCARIVVVKLEKDAVPATGVIYALPRTVVRVQVKVDKVEKKGVPFRAYAKIFAPDGKPVCDVDCGVEYSVQQGATFATYGEPDPSNVFLVQFTGGGAIDQALSMTWNEAGILSASSASVTNRTIDIVTSGVKAVTGLGVKAIGAGAEKALDPKTCREVDSTFVDAPGADRWFLPLLKNAGLTPVTNYCSLLKEDREKLKRDDEALLKRAVKAYQDRVAPLVTARENILKADSNFIEPVGLLPRLDAEIASRFAELFLGSKTTTTWEGAVDLRELVEAKPIPVLKLTSAGACLPAGAELPPDGKLVPDGYPAVAACGPDRADEATTTISVRLDYHPRKESQLFTRLTDQTGERSFRYRLAAQMKATLEDDRHKVYGSGVFSVAQFGTVISLPARRASKGLSYDLGFVESTGALKTFKLGTTGGLDSATVDAFAAAGGTTLDARNKLRQKDDELTALTRQGTLLKLKDEICTIQKKYNLPCSVSPE